MVDLLRLLWVSLALGAFVYLLVIWQPLFAVAILPAALIPAILEGRDG